MRNLKRVVSVAAALAMTATVFTGCSMVNTNTAGGGQASEDGMIWGDGNGNPVNLTVFSQLANYSGEQTGWIADILMEKFGVTLTIIPDVNGTLQTRMEAGDLGDIVVFGSDGDAYTNAVQAGLLFDWNEDDVLADYGPYINEHMKNALEKNANIAVNAGISTDPIVYGFGHNVASSTKSHEAMSSLYSWDIRWDLYKQLGYPEIKNLDDLLEVLTQMQEIYPTDKNGNKTYAISLWPDWDGNMVMYVKSTATTVYGMDELGIGLYDPADGSFHGALEENGPYLTCLKFYNQLYQRGLLDPDSMTNTYDKATEKVKAGGTFFSIFGYAGHQIANTEENMDEGIFMASLVPSETHPLAYGMSTMGGNRVWTIGAKSAYPELCMEIINYLCTPEGYMTYNFGPQGVTWDYDEDKNCYLTDLGKSAMADQDNTDMSEAGYVGSFHDGMIQINNTTWSLDDINPDSNGEPYNYKAWKSYNEEPLCEMDQDWRDFTGCTTLDEYLETTDFKLMPHKGQYSETPRSDEFKTQCDQTKKAIVDGSWRAMYAKTDAEFDQIVKEMTDEANSYYYKEFVEWSENEAILIKAEQDSLAAND